MTLSALGRGLRLFALIACCALAESSAFAEQAPEPPRIEGFEVVGVDLNTGAFVKRLPFDVPFFVTGQTLPNTIRLRVQYKVSKDTIAIQESDRRCQPSGWQPASPLMWIPAQVSQTATEFRVLVGRLDVDRYYLFRFCFDSQLSEMQVKEFGGVARTVLDRELQNIRSLTIPRPVSAAIQRQLSQALNQVFPRGVTIDPGTMFDPDLPADSPLIKQFEAVLLGVVAPQMNLPTIRQAYSQGAGEIAELLRMLRGSPLAQVVQAMRERPDAVRAAQLATFRDSVALVEGDLDLANERSLGRLPTVPGTPVSELWKPDPVGTYEANYRRLVMDLNALKDFVTAAVGDDAAAAALQLPADVIASARALRAPNSLIDQAVGRIDRMAPSLTRLRTGLADREDALNALVKFVELHAQDLRFAVGTTSQVVSTNYNPYVSVDAGVLYAPVIGEATLYIATNIYTRPVNKDAPLSQVSSFRRRFAFTFGVTLNSIADSAHTRFDLFSSSTLVLGAGYRVTQSLRLGGGAIVLKEADPNPLIDRQSAALTPYLSLSFDVDVAKGMSKIFGSNLQP